MGGPLRITKNEISIGLKAGRRLIQEEWAHPDEIRFVDELVADGIADAGLWEYRDGFQCERRVVTAP
jgi:hypothetical protein